MIVAPTLSRLCGDVDVFLAEHWERRPLHTHAGDMGDLFSLEEADELLGAGAMQVPNYLRLSRIDPTTIDWEQHCRWMDSGQGPPTPFIDVHAAVRAYEAGRTIIFHSLRDRVPALDEFAHEIEREIGHRLSVDAFLTPPESACWEPHYDVVDLFVLQVHGSKRWKLWEATVDAPLPTHHPGQSDTVGEPELIDVLEGDVLYVPRGVPHAATTGAEPSLHVTISINATTWRDALRAVLGPLYREASFRASLPVGYNDDSTALVDGLRGALEHMDSMLADVRPGVAAEMLADRVELRRSSHVGLLRDVVASSHRDESARR